MYDAIDAILMISLIVENHKDKKQVKKLILKLLNKVKPDVKQAVVLQVLESPSYREAIYNHSFNFLTLERVADEVNNLGCAGMIIYEAVAYPIQLVPASEYEKQWMLHNESTLCKMVAENLAKELHTDELQCSVVLFRNRGFSGVRQLVKYTGEKPVLQLAKRAA